MRDDPVSRGLLRRPGVTLVDALDGVRLVKQSGIDDRFVSLLVLGIGGGVIHMPVLVQLLGFPLHIATATSHFILAIMSGTGSLTHLLEGSYGVGHGLRRAIALSAGVIVGAQVGAQISLRASAPLIQRLLSLALLAIALRLALTV